MFIVESEQAPSSEHCVLPFAAVAYRIGDPWHSSSIEKVVSPNLLDLELEVNGALLLWEVLVWL